MRLGRERCHLEHCCCCCLWSFLSAGGHWGLNLRPCTWEHALHWVRHRSTRASFLKIPTRWRFTLRESARAHTCTSTPFPAVRCGLTGSWACVGSPGAEAGAGPWQSAYSQRPSEPFAAAYWAVGYPVWSGCGWPAGGVCDLCRGWTPPWHAHLSLPSGECFATCSLSPQAMPSGLQGAGTGTLPACCVSLICIYGSGPALLPCPRARLLADI